jgi:hypothetical protein
MNEKRKRILAWLFFGVIAASVVGAVLFDVSMRPAGDPFSPPEVLIAFVPLSFALVGALIISRQPANVIGLLMMGPGVSLFMLVDAVLRPYIVGQLPPPETPSNLFLLTLWFSNWNWQLLVFPLMFIMVLFPTGRPLSRYWGWLIFFGLGIMAFFVTAITFVEVLTPGSGGEDWVVENPIGFLDPERIDFVVIPFVTALPIWVILCVISLLVRFRRARGVEREQIKWLFYTAAVFALFYVPAFIQGKFEVPDNLTNFLFVIGMLIFPTGIAIAILRYRLYDIDIIIRRTLQYTLLSGILILVYLGGVFVIESVLRGLVGSPNSPLVTVITTLGVAALFNPLRVRVQDFIDRRFYRRKYDAENAYNQFAALARDEIDLERLAEVLLGVVEETMQPEHISLWLGDEMQRPRRG